jgi:hypothetical protein
MNSSILMHKQGTSAGIVWGTHNTLCPRADLCTHFLVLWHFWYPEGAKHEIFGRWSNNPTNARHRLLHPIQSLFVPPTPRPCI